MLFNSTEYLIFFSLVLALTWICAGLPKIRIWILLLSSYYFYISNNHWLIVLIIFSTQVDYIAALRIEKSTRSRTRTLWLFSSIVANLGTLGVFKYFNFFAGSLCQIGHLIGWTPTWVDLEVALPVGISFYTFQSMSYTVDVYKKSIPAEKSWVRFAFFVAFFPQLVAGPIVRPNQFLPQLDRKPRLTVKDLDFSILIIIRGLLKKVIVADQLGHYVDVLFADPTGIPAATTLLYVYFFAFQIYFDFSGYTDIAIGCSRLLGYHLPVNFRRPYVATSITDFWRRWHISLSTWLRDYLYIPLGGSRLPAKTKTYRNLMITMGLGGLWHGAAWTFVIWGIMHGVFLCAERAFGIKPSVELKPRLITQTLKIILIFHLVCVTWVVFRADTVSTAAQIYSNILSMKQGFELTYGALMLSLIICFNALVQLIVERRPRMIEQIQVPLLVKGFFYAAGVILLILLNTEPTRPFIYFKF